MTLISIPANPVPDQHIIGTIKTRDGVTLDARLWARDPHRVVVYLHGYATDQQALDAFMRLARLEGISWFGLQAGMARPWDGSGLDVFDPMPGVADFADTAAIVANLDLVVGVDTSVVHVGGALGKPVLLLDRYDNCWRWLHGRADSPWYPSMAILRQTRPLDWSAPVERA